MDPPLSLVIFSGTWTRKAEEAFLQAKPRRIKDICREERTDINWAELSINVLQVPCFSLFSKVKIHACLWGLGDTLVRKPVFIEKEQCLREYILLD